MTKTSPCIGFCRLDEASGLCGGCARTRNEIAAWSKASAQEQERIWTELPTRRTQLGIGLFRRDWSREQIREFVTSTLRAGAGTWVCGTFGAVAEFNIGAGEPVDFDFGPARMTAGTPRAAIRIELPDSVRALAAPTTMNGARHDVMVLAVPREPTPIANGVAALGPDRDAIRPVDRDALLYDFGLGMKSASFCVRTADPELIRRLNGFVGQSWQSLLHGMGGELLQASPTRVVRSAIARIEVSVPIPLPEGRSPIGPHTHFLPAHLAENRETPPGMELPDALMPCAMFYPETQPADSCT